jgi:hypothetical protein
MTQLDLELVQAAFATILQSGLAQFPQAVRLEETPVFETDADGHRMFTGRPRLSWGLFVNLTLEATKESPPVSTLLEAVKSSLHDERAPREAQSLVAGFVSQVLADVKDPENFTVGSLDAVIEATFHDLEALLARAPFTSRHTYAITGILPDGPVEIGPGMTLAPVDEDTRRAIWAKIGSSPNQALADTTIHAIGSVSAELRLEASMTIDDLSPLARSAYPFMPVMDALRLVSPGAVYWLGSFTVFTPFHRFLVRLFPTGTMRPGHLHERSFSAAPIPLRPADSEVLARVYADLSQHTARLSESETAAFDVALQRFRDSYERHSDNDRILDSWIALEALFLAESETEGVSYRLGMRIARFVGEDPEERRRLFSQVHRSYGLRSRLAHGSTARARRKYEPISERAEEILDVLRRATCRWIQADGE